MRMATIWPLRMSFDCQGTTSLWFGSWPGNGCAPWLKNDFWRSDAHFGTVCSMIYKCQIIVEINQKK